MSTVSLQSQESSLLDYSLMVAFSVLSKRAWEWAERQPKMQATASVTKPPMTVLTTCIIFKGFPRFLMAMRAWKRLTTEGSKTLQPARLSETF
jgi:hypothetical protein